LDHPVDRQTEGGGHRRRASAHDQPHPFASPVEHGGDIGQAGARGVVNPLLAGFDSQHTDDPAHLGERLPTRLGDRCQRLGRSLGMLGGQGPAPFGLHDDDAQRVGHHVV
jgi:hypothetical protein